MWCTVINQINHFDRLAALRIGEFTVLSLARLLRVLVLPVSGLHRLVPLRGEQLPAAVRHVQPGRDLGPGDPAAGGLAGAPVAALLHEAQAQHQGATQ